MKWAYGLTTVPKRLKDLFPRTLASLAKAGFDKPRLFVDNCEYPSLYDGFGLEVTHRWPCIRTYGNWILALAELYIREPNADRYAIFQDDFVTMLGLREYLEKCNYPTRAYLNLYTFPANQRLAPDKNGWYQSNQAGYGAVALVFSRDAVTTLLGQQSMIERPKDTKRGHKSVDGAIVSAFKKAGWKEYVHNPSLVQHTGLLSSMGNSQHPLAESFPGEDYNALDLLGDNYIEVPPSNEWEIELASLKRAMQEDRERLAAAGTQKEISHFKLLIAKYERRIAVHMTKANR